MGLWQQLRKSKYATQQGDKKKSREREREREGKTVVVVLSYTLLTPNQNLAAHESQLQSLRPSVKLSKVKF